VARHLPERAILRESLPQAMFRGAEPKGSDNLAAAPEASKYAIATIILMREEGLLAPGGPKSDDALND
jgi:hypothetical protein